MNFIHPGALTEEKYEELKVLIPNTCKVKGCCNNWNFGPDGSKFSNLLGKIYGINGDVTGKNVRNGICDFHRVYNTDGSRNTSYSTDHTDSKPDNTTPGKVIENINAETLKNLELSVGYQETELDYINFNSEEIRRVTWKEKILDDEIFPVASQIISLKEIRSSDIGEERNNKKAHNDKQLELRKKFVELMKKILGKEPTTGGNNPSYLPINNQNQNIKELRVAAIVEISQFLNKEPKITDQELEENNRGWRVSIENSNSSKQINDLRDKILADIRGKRRGKVNSNKLFELVKKGQETEDYEELKKLVEQIEKFRGEENYKLLESKINAIKGKLAQKNLVEYCMTVFKMIEEEMMTKSVKKDELDVAVKKELQKLEKREINDPAEIDIVKNKISDNIGKISAKKILVELIKNYQKSSDENSKNTAKKKNYLILLATKIISTKMLIKLEKVK